jgi:hypothetical protein
MPWSIFREGGGPGVAVTWAQQLLQMLGVSETPQNVQFVYDWEVSEGSGGKYNPLNQGPVPGHPELTTTGQQYGGGAADFASWQAGLQGAADFIRMSFYSGVLSGLKQGSYGAAEQALWQSPWASSHYGYGSRWSTATPPGAAPIPATDLAATTPGTPGGQNPAISRIVKLGPGQWWITFSIGDGPTLVQGSEQEVKSWTQQKYGKSFPIPGTSVNWNWNSGAGLFGGSSALLIGPFPSESTAQSQWAAKGLHAGPASGNEAGYSDLIPGLSGLIQLAGDFLTAIEWLFVPSHWVRIGAFAFGVLTLAPGLYALLKTGQGSMYLPLGILLISISAGLFFIAFHNLPSNVTNIGELAGHISSGVKASTPAQAPAA